MTDRPDVDRATAEDLTSLVTDVGPAPMQVGAVLVLETSDDFDLRAARATIAQRVGSIPRLRQCLRQAPFGCGRPFWVDDPGFDITEHVLIDDGPRGGGPEAVLAAAADLVATRLPPDRPLWVAEFVRVDPATIALIVVFHHVLTDGIGGLAVLAGLVDGAPESPAYGLVRPAPSSRELAVDAFRDRAQRLRDLREVPRRLAAALRELRATGRTRASRSSLNQPTGPRRSLAVADVDLSAIIDVAHFVGGSVNDVVLSAVDGALVRLLASRGEQVDRFVASVPVTRRRATTATELGNQVGVAPIELPGIEDRLARLRAVSALGAQVRTSPRGASAELLGPVFRVLARLGVFRWFVDRQRLVDTFVTNLRGPANRLTFLGAPISKLLPIPGITGNVAVAFGVMSYAGTLAVTIVADPETVPDLSLLRIALQQELDAYAECVVS